MIRLLINNQVAYTDIINKETFIYMKGTHEIITPKFLNKPN